jgi:hypothetical protein
MTYGGQPGDVAPCQSTVPAILQGTGELNVWSEGSSLGGSIFSDIHTITAYSVQFRYRDSDLFRPGTTTGIYAVTITAAPNTLSSRAKVGIAVAIPITVLSLTILGVFLFLRRISTRRSKNSVGSNSGDSHGMFSKPELEAYPAKLQQKFILELDTERDPVELETPQDNVVDSSQTIQTSTALDAGSTEQGGTNERATAGIAETEH